jgi:hypothetical protein
MATVMAVPQSRPPSGEWKRRGSHSLQHTEKVVYDLPLAMKKATRNLKRIIKPVPPDIQVHNLIKVELYNRKINIGDRDLFERGLKHESMDENDQAATCYTRYIYMYVCVYVCMCVYIYI